MCALPNTEEEPRSNGHKGRHEVQKEPSTRRQHRKASKRSTGKGADSLRQGRCGKANTATFIAFQCSNSCSYHAFMTNQRQIADTHFRTRSQSDCLKRVSTYTLHLLSTSCMSSRSESSRLCSCICFVFSRLWHQDQFWCMSWIEGELPVSLLLQSSWSCDIGIGPSRHSIGRSANSLPMFRS